MRKENFDAHDVRAHHGHDIASRQGMSEEKLRKEVGENLGHIEMEEVSMFHIDARDQAASRDAEAYEVYVASGRGPSQTSSRRVSPVCSSSALWRHHSEAHSINLQPAPTTPPSVWQTLMVRKEGTQSNQFVKPEGKIKYWAYPSQRDRDRYIEGLTRDRNEGLLAAPEIGACC